MKLEQGKNGILQVTDDNGNFFVIDPSKVTGVFAQAGATSPAVKKAVKLTVKYEDGKESGKMYLGFDNNSDASKVKAAITKGMNEAYNDPKKPRFVVKQEGPTTWRLYINDKLHASASNRADIMKELKNAQWMYRNRTKEPFMKESNIAESVRGLLKQFISLVQSDKPAEAKKVLKQAIDQKIGARIQKMTPTVAKGLMQEKKK